MASDDGDTILVFNGELYNHMELRRDLEQSGPPVPLALRHGDRPARISGMGHRCVPPLPGDVCGGLLDAIGKAAGAGARSHGDQAPVLRPPPGKYLFRLGAEGDLAPSGDRPDDRSGGPGGLSLAQLRSRDRGRWWRESKSFRRAPGSNGARARSPRGEYWRLEFDPDPKRDLASAKEELDGLLRSAVREQLVSDVPLGVWSSGGLDSSTILHYASETARGRLKTFSVSFQGRSFDESRYFRRSRGGLWHRPS